MIRQGAAGQQLPKLLKLNEFHDEFAVAQYAAWQGGTEAKMEQREAEVKRREDEMERREAEVKRHEDEMQRREARRR